MPISDPLRISDIIKNELTLRMFGGMFYFVYLHFSLVEVTSTCVRIEMYENIGTLQNVYYTSDWINPT